MLSRYCTVLTCVLIIGSASLGWTFTLAQEEGLTIISEYYANDDSDSTFQKTWNVAVENNAGDSLRLTYYLSNNLSRAVCEIIFSGENDDIQIEWHDLRTQKILRDDKGLLLVPQFPAPCNLLPLKQKAVEQKYAIQRKAGGRTFVKLYRVTREEIDYSSAVENGWIKKTGVKPTTFIILTVYDEQNLPAVKQLWPIDGGWWLYEETPDRRSWLIR